MNEQLVTQNKNKLLLGILISLFFLLQFQLWIGKGSLLEVGKFYSQVNGQKQKNQSLLNRNKELEVRIDDLRKNPGAIEELARKRLGMIKKDEAFFFTVKQK